MDCQEADYEYWVLHSPYPNKTWRGIEKCVDSLNGGPLLFETSEQAFAYAQDQGLEEFLTPVQITLTVPRVGAPIK